MDNTPKPLPRGILTENGTFSSSYPNRLRTISQGYVVEDEEGTQYFWDQYLEKQDVVIVLRIDDNEPFYFNPNNLYPSYPNSTNEPPFEGTYRRVEPDDELKFKIAENLQTLVNSRRKRGQNKIIFHFDALNTNYSLQRLNETLKRWIDLETILND